MSTVETAAEDVYTAFTDREPAVTRGLLYGAVSAPAGGILSALAVGGVISPAHASALTASISGAVVAVVLAAVTLAQAFSTRAAVSPEWKLFERSHPSIAADVEDVAGRVEDVSRYLTGTAAPKPTPGPRHADPEPVAVEPVPVVEPVPDAPVVVPDPT